MYWGYSLKSPTGRQHRPVTQWGSTRSSLQNSRGVWMSAVWGMPSAPPETWYSARETEAVCACVFGRRDWRRIHLPWPCRQIASLWPTEAPIHRSSCRSPDWRHSSPYWAWFPTACNWTWLVWCRRSGNPVGSTWCPIHSSPCRSLRGSIVRSHIGLTSLGYWDRWSQTNRQFYKSIGNQSLSQSSNFDSSWTMYNIILFLIKTKGFKCFVKILFFICICYS